ncbi:MAG: PQQ-dependent sugar dehydrogenase [Chitinophagaceae bacterium]
MKYSIPLLALLIATTILSCNNEEKPATTTTVAADSTAITVPEGFSYTVFADSLGRARHLVVNSNGDVYVKLERLNGGRGIMRLRDTNNDGVADDVSGFAGYKGTGIAIKDGYLYASSDDDIYRYKLGQDGTPDTASGVKIVEGLLNKREHASKSIALDNAGNIYVNIGAPSNACQEKNREKGSPGMNPCPILDSAGGIWQFKIDKPNQHYSDGTRFITGIRNIVGLDWNSDVNELYAMQHGRDDLDRLYPELYTEAQRVELPAEEMFRLKKGGDYGWPYCYYDPAQKLKVQSPEYGGDGKKTTGCEGKEKPIYAFPAHWAPNAMLFYTGTQFPEKYKNGAFIAFHGSWNRAPQTQAGYKVVFLPFKNGVPSGEYEVFADGFAGAAPGEKITDNGARYRPCGLAQGSDGSLYVSDDNKGRVWKVSYKK